MHDVIDQNDHMAKNEQKPKKPAPVPYSHFNSEENHYAPHLDEEEFEMNPQDYHQLIDHSENPQKTPVSEHSNILAEQNFEYEEMQRKMIEKKEEEELL